MGWREVRSSTYTIMNSTMPGANITSLYAACPFHRSRIVLSRLEKNKTSHELEERPMYYLLNEFV